MSWMAPSANPLASIRRRLARLDDRGIVSAEAALVLPLLVLAAVVALTGVRAAGVQLACQDAAQAGARAAARGDSDAVVRQTALRLAPGESSVVVRHAGSYVEVTVTAPIRAFPATPAIRVEATSLAEAES